MDEAFINALPGLEPVLEMNTFPKKGVESIFEPLSYTLAMWINGGWGAMDTIDKKWKLFNIIVVEDK